MCSLWRSSSPRLCLTTFLSVSVQRVSSPWMPSKRTTLCAHRCGGHLLFLWKIQGWETLRKRKKWKPFCTCTSAGGEPTGFSGPYLVEFWIFPRITCTYVFANCRDLEEALEMGVDWSLREGYAWAEDKEHCEEYGRMLQADPNKVSSRAKKRGLPQVKLCFKRVLSAPRVQSER